MRVIETVAEMQEFRRGLPGKIAMVATLGGMHAGHEAHLVKAQEVADVTIGSLFLNPTQFARGEDLANYPAERAQDLATFKRYGTVAVFAPSADEMYPPGDTFRVNPGPIATILEGRSRPEHFVGVATIVSKLFNTIRPDVATFGEKDAQQLRIIEKLNRELKVGIEIIRIPTVREPDGLALSSRNRYLTGELRATAPILYRSLMAGRKLWDSGERDADAVRSTVQDVLQTEPLVVPDYVSVADPCSLEELSGAAASDALVSLAARIGPARLIDNIMLLS